MRTYSDKKKETRMIVNEYIRKFEELGLGLFVHFGLYSVHGKGEWAYNRNISPEDYQTLTERFSPDPDWAQQLALVAKSAGCRYITLTTRHHDGYSLFDTCGLNTYDAPHAMGRDLVREFVDACREQGLIPFFYHTLLDWHEPSYRENFPEYLKYLRSSVELLCKNYGEIGGLWFDGMWDKKEADWEEDELYGLIRRYQPKAMIINNTGLSAGGKRGHKEIDALTFERGRPRRAEEDGEEKHLATEMCQVFANHWGYAARDFNFKSLPEILGDLCICRRHGANLLLNVGPMGNGKLRELDRAMLTTFGEWVEIHKEALYSARPTDIEVEGKEKEFLLRGDGCYYFFAYGLPMKANVNVELERERPEYQNCFSLPEKIKSVKWLDNGEPLSFVQERERVTLTTAPQRYGEQLVIKVARIEI